MEGASLGYPGWGGIGGYDWYGDDCYALTPYGYRNVCGYNYY